MINLTIVWIAIPLLLGFIISLTPKLGKYLALFGSLISVIYSLQILFNNINLSFQLLDNFGVTFRVDSLSGYFILTNAIVTTAVIIYCWQQEKTAFFYGQIILLHTSLNSAFITTDFITLYVALEVIGMIAFTLIVYPRTDRSLWIGLRYLFISSIVMLFYLGGSILVYKANNSFYFEGLKNSPPEAFVLIFLGLLVKGGIFISGLWLPLTHAESESPVSALLSGIVVKASILPLIRCAEISEDIDFIIRLLGVGTAILGVFYALLEKDIKRMFAFSTISQLGFILASPSVGGFYALTHGLAKCTLFLTAGYLPTRNLSELKKNGINTSIWIPLSLASISMIGFPFFSSFEAKVLTIDNLLSWQVIPMNIVAIGTTIYFFQLILLPHKSEKDRKISFNLLLAVTLLIFMLLSTNIIYYEAYILINIIKALIIVLLGFLFYRFILRKIVINVPRILEEFDNIVGFLTLMCILLYGVLLMVNSPLL
ncbi:MAG: cation:proton antiporter [Cyanobacteria bacterium]|nr:cation:proton antiporter [Cyanobacteria bacterium CG_2015-16_32_12]NCO79307.1 cation:proton antiporter [Cyanobacteria bacterium CG_2015-22_32_23]NCQ05045.1 cation:proton antiporter [Cyanobacteria bacterium CG_2015-09_32_10]NCQ41331.1 cation:proton antiporter [Cyanobacteria bacterium CG_2015-04_32_10]NCS84044.1 cation:proton antiporter [Cyanobacteria bacterium CG_2015-02_32_10]